MIRLLLLLNFVLINIICSAQNGFIRVLGRDTTDLYLDMEELPDGGLMFGGPFKDTFNLIRCNATADTMWTKKIPIPPVELGTFAILKDRRIAILGKDTAYNPIFGWQAASCVTDSAGNLIGGFSIGGIGVNPWGTAPVEVASTPDSGFIYTEYEDGLTCDNYYSITKYDKNLQINSQIIFSSCDYKVGLPDHVNKNSNLYPYAYHDSYELSLINMDHYEHVLMDSIYYSPVEEVYQISGTADSSILLCGIRDTLNSTDVILKKFNADGSIAFEKVFGTGYDDFPAYVMETTDHGYAVLSSEKVPVTWENVDIDFWKLDNNGNITSHQTFGSTGAEYAVKMIRKNDGSIVILGRTNGFGPKRNFIIQLDTLGNLILPYAITSAARNYCSGQTATLTVQPAAQSYLWSTGETTQAINVTTTGNYQVNVTDGAGAVFSAIYTVYFDSLPDANILTVSPIHLCAGKTVQLDVPYHQGSSYKWFRDGVLIDTVFFNSITIDTSGMYMLVDSNGCGADTSAQIQVFYHPLPLPPVVIASPSFHGCGPLTFTDSLIRSDSLIWFLNWHYQYSGDTFTFNLTGINALISVTSIDSNSCQSPYTSFNAESDSIYPQIDFATDSMDICIPGVTILPLTVSTNIGEFTLQSPHTIITSLNPVSVTFYAFEEGMHYTVMKNACGADSDSIYISAFQKPVINIFPDTPVICSANPFLLTCTTPGIYDWNVAGQIFSSQSISVTSSDSCSITLTDSISGCQSHKTIFPGQSNNAFPLFGLSPEYILCPGDSVALNAGAWSAYYWSNGSFDSSQVFQYNNLVDTEMITVTVTDSMGCSNTDSVLIISDICQSIVVNEDQLRPLIFPNPAHEQFYVDINLHEKNASCWMIIYNSIGQVVYENKFQRSGQIDTIKFVAGLYYIKFINKQYEYNSILEIN